MYPNAFYRVSVKALIRNEKGHVLVLKENQDTWSLPGGGLDHGENAAAGLRRELKEELNLEVKNEISPAQIKTFYLESYKSWLLWIVFIVSSEAQDFEFGEGVKEAKFINPAFLSKSEDIFEQLVYEVSSEL